MFSLFSTLSVYTCGPPDQQYEKYAIVFDAGSSSTKVHAYGFKPGQLNLPLELQINTSQYSSKSNIPVSKLGVLPNLISKLFDEDLKGYVQKATSGCENITTVYVIGTAGMRVLSEDEQEGIYDSIRLHFNQSDYWNKFIYEDDSIMTIPGYQEAIYAWYAVYSFYPEQDFASVEIGGGSAQLAFTNGDKSFKNYQHSITFNGTNISVFAVSWLSLGIDSALLNLSLSIAANTGSSKIQLPCYPKGVKLNSIHNVDIEIEGTGNYDECQEIFTKYTLVQDSCKSKKSKCIFEDIPLPKDLNNVFGISVFDYAPEFFRDHNNNGTWPTPASNETIQNIGDFARDYCSKSWDDILETYNNTGKDYSSNLLNYCAQMAYSNLFLENGLHISPTSQSVVRNSTIDGTSINWAYGIILAKASLDAPTIKNKYMALTVAIGIIVGLILVSLIVFFIMKIRKSREESDDFIPLQSSDSSQDPLGLSIKDPSYENQESTLNLSLTS